MTGQVGITSQKWEKSINESKWWENSWNYKKKSWKTNKVECLQKFSDYIKVKCQDDNKK